MAERIKNTHKDMAPTDEWRLPLGSEIMGGVDLSREGGLITTDGEVTYYVKSPFWRSIKGDPVVRMSDVNEIEYINKAPDYLEICVGSEIELWGWDMKTRDVAEVMSPQAPLRRVLDSLNGNGVNFERDDNPFDEDLEKLNYSDELAISQIEINFPHSADNIERGVFEWKALRKLAIAAERNNVYVLPVGSLPHRALARNDVSQNPYVERIALEHMGWDRVRHFVGTCYQNHIDMFDSEAGLKSINHLQQVAPLMLGLSSSAPFLNGKILLDKDGLPGANAEPSTWHSVRYAGRLSGSPNGGPIEFPAPKTLEEFYELAQERLRTGVIPTPARTLGNHTDFRFRMDLNTIESSITDNFGAHPVKLSMISELNRALAFKVQVLISQGRERELPRQLFTALDEDGIQRARRNALEVSRRGLDAGFELPNEKPATARESLYKLVKWVSVPMKEVNYPGLPEGVLGEIAKSSININTTSLASNYDPASEDYLKGYYETGLGTLSQWLINRARALTEAGESEEEAIKTCMSELAVTFHTFIKDPGLEQKIKDLFK